MPLMWQEIEGRQRAGVECQSNFEETLMMVLAASARMEQKVFVLAEAPEMGSAIARV